MLNVLNVGRPTRQKKKSHLSNGQRLHTRRNGVGSRETHQSSTRHAVQDTTIRHQFCARVMFVLLLRVSRIACYAGYSSVIYQYLWIVIDLPATSLQFDKHITNGLAAALYTKSVLLVVVNFW